MRRELFILLALTILLCSLVCSSAFADNSERIQELFLESLQLQDRALQAETLIDNVEIRRGQIGAIVGELNRQDKLIAEATQKAIAEAEENKLAELK